MQRAVFLGLAASLALSACATMEDPVNAPPPLSMSDRQFTAGVVHSDVIVPVGAATVAQGAVSRDQPVVSFGYQYRHTATLIEDVVGYSITVSGVQAPRGSPGYYAGMFESSGVGSSRASELWCFMPGVVGGERKHLCFLRNQPGIAAIAPTRMNPYLWTAFAPATGSFDYVRTPIYERGPVEIPGDLKLEYRFQGWTPRAARLTEYAVGREVRDLEAPRGADGVALLRTVAGDFALTPAPDAPDRAVVSPR